MKLFLGKDPGDENHPWDEFLMQAYCIQEGRRAGYLVSGGMEQGKRTKSSSGRAKASGLTKGWPDVTWCLPGGKVIFIEYKKLNSGRLSEAQENLHSELKNRQHEIYTIWAKSPKDCWEQTKKILEGK